MATGMFGCSSTNLAGTGTETSTKGTVAGKIIDQNGTAAPHTLIVLVPVAYDPAANGSSPALLIDTSSSDGSYSITNVDSGDYNIQAVHLDTRARGLVRGISVERDNVTAPVDTLRKPGAIKVVLPGDIDPANGYVFVPGTTIYSLLLGNSGSVMLDSIPAGPGLSVCYAVNGSSLKPRLFRDSVSVAPGTITTITNVAWKFLKKLSLNTTASGAQVTGTVENFPVLVRLSAANFNFGQAHGSGSDIRFTKPNGTSLPYEIERWDSLGRNAEIWIKVDTIYGNDSTHFITMYWGNPNAASGSSSSAVFDTADGNVGVWHLGPGLDDATPNADNGIDSATADTAGLIGRCRHFDPNKRSFIAIPNESRFDLTTKITLSAWVQIDTFSLEWQTILAKGDDTYRLHRDGLLNRACFSLTTVDTANFGYYSLRGTKQIDDRSWHLVCGVFDGTTMQLYVDGNLENDSLVSLPCGTNNLNLIIGDNRTRTLNNTPRFFDGAIDEVRVMRTAVNKDWVKLCYMNQMQSDKLIVFK
jgi:hypothetical protein